MRDFILSAHRSSHYPESGVSADLSARDLLSTAGDDRRNRKRRRAFAL